MTRQFKEDNINFKKEEINLGKEKSGLEANKDKESIDLSNLKKLIDYIKDKNEYFLEMLELEELIGKGCESHVYRAKVKQHKRLISVKMINWAKNVKSNVDEYKISKKLKNKNIIDTHGIYSIKEGELDCIMAEYAKYNNLKTFQIKLLKRNNLSESFLCYITKQVLNGLKYMHINKIVHFDLKPKNLVMDKYLNVKIIDFSVSLDYKDIKYKSIKLQFRGTDYYIPPEVNKKEIINVKDLVKIDLFSLGVTLFNLAFGGYPYELSYEETNNFKNKIKLKDKNSLFSKLFYDFLIKLLDKDINKRINLNEAINHCWVKGADILFDEKEKIYDANCFLLCLITNHFKIFNEYIKNNNNYFLTK